MQIQQDLCYEETMAWRNAQVEWRNEFQTSQDEKFRMFNAKMDNHESKPGVVLF